MGVERPVPRTGQEAAEGDSEGSLRHAGGTGRYYWAP